jgi:hypothetical protein
MTDGGYAILAGCLIAGGYVAQVLDYIMTCKGLDRGMTEVGLLNRLFIKSKADESKLPVITFVESAAYTMVCALIGHYFGMPALAAYAGGFLAVEAINDVHSFLLLKK